jgi:hypothetical protein
MMRLLERSERGNGENKEICKKEKLFCANPKVLELAAVTKLR